MNLMQNLRQVFTTNDANSIAFSPCPGITICTSVGGNYLPGDQKLKPNILKYFSWPSKKVSWFTTSSWYIFYDKSGQAAGPILIQFTILLPLV